MARPIDAEEHAGRRRKILESARRILVSQGYEGMTIESILAEAGISNGTFFHYFRAKSEVLEAIVEELVSAMQALARSSSEEHGLSAVEKLNRFFSSFGVYKTSGSELLASVFEVWYADGNAVVRSRIRSSMLEKLRSPIADIVRQGKEEAVFTPTYPEHAAQALLAIAQDLVDAMAGIILSPEEPARQLKEIAACAASYTQIIERALGAPAGSLRIVDPKQLRQSVGRLARRPKET